MTDSPLPDPATLYVRVHVGRDGCRFEVLARDPVGHQDESVYICPAPASSPKTAEHRGVAWIAGYAAATDKERCRLCGYSWSAVKRALTRQRAEASPTR
ncbi:MAG: hypothetical protein AAGG38_15010 [Planctomycetota bacterium]